MATTTPPSTVSSPSSKAPSQHAHYAGPPAVNILPSSSAQTYAHVHPTLLLAVYAFRFRALVADPVSTLLNDLPLYAGLQVAYVVTCLPQAGSTHHYQQHSDSSGDTSSTSPSSGSGAGAAGTPTPGGSKVGKAAYRKKHSSANKPDTIFQKLTVRYFALVVAAAIFSSFLLFTNS